LVFLQLLFLLSKNTVLAQPQLQCDFFIDPTTIALGDEYAASLHCTGPATNYYLQVKNESGNVVQTLTIYILAPGRRENVLIPSPGSTGNYTVIVLSDPDDPSSQVGEATLTVEESNTPPPTFRCILTIVDETFVCPAQCPQKGFAPGMAGGSLVCKPGFPQVLCRLNPNALDEDPDGVDTAIGCIPITDINATTAFFLRWALGIGGGIALFLISVSAIKIMTTRGDPKRVQDARDTLSAAIAGIVIIVLSVFLVRFLTETLLRLF